MAHMMNLCIILLLLTCSILGKKPVIVHLDQGSYRGEKHHNHYRFLGIRYAQPAVRFTPPIPFKPITSNKDNIEDATEWKSACPHFPNEPLSGVSRDLLKPRKDAYSEDCFFLNVFTPKLPLNFASISFLPTSINTHKLPVLIFIHGGAFYSGTSSAHLYDPSEWIRQFPTFVAVTFEYRLGPLGYLAATAPGLIGNYGLMDQILAIKWVYANIDHFGGSPDHIHIMGHSAGSISASWIAALETKILPFPIFGYILMSGVGSMWPKRKGDGVFESIQYDTLLEETGCNDVECLRNVPIELLEKANEKMQLAYTWGPAIDGNLITVPFYRTDHYNRKAKIIITAVRDEGSIFVPRNYEEIADVFFKDKLPLILPFYGRKLSFQIINAIITDALFICPMHHFYNERKRNATDPTNVQYFLLEHAMLFTAFASAFNGGRDHGVFHGSDMLMLFGNHPLLSTTYAHITTELRRGITEFITKGIIPREIHAWSQEKSALSKLYMEAFEHWSLENHHCTELWNSNEPLMPKNYKSKLSLPEESESF